MFKLRYYQEDSVRAIDDYFIAQRGSNPIVVVPTAGGKSVIIAEYIKRNVAKYACRFMMVTHAKELIEQNFAKLTALCPELDAGIYSASVGRKETDNQVVFAGIQSVYQKAKEIGHVDVILVDECHLIPKRGNGMYRTFLDEMLTINPLLKVVGFTATPYRLSGGYLYEGIGRIFDGVAHEVTVRELLNKGYIAPLVTPKEELVQPNLDQLDIQNGDFVQYKLAQVAQQDQLVKRAVHQLWLHAKDRTHWLCFAVSIEHAEEIAKEIRLKGITAEVVTGKTKKKERERLLKAFNTGEIHCLVNVGVLTTGFDEPQIQVLGCFRSTESTALFIQMLGRGVRLHPDKEDCLLMDFAGLLARHSHFDDPEIGKLANASSGDGVGEAPTKTCSQCDQDVHLAVTVCPFCGHEFPESENPRHSDVASALPIYATEKGERIYQIDEMTFRVHKKAGKPDYCRIDYCYEGKVRASDYLGFEHGTFMYAKSVQIFLALLPNEEVPFNSLNAVVALNLNAKRLIKAIKTKRVGKYNEVIARQLH